MAGFKLTYCSKCRTSTAHDLYVSTGGYLHSLCTDCGKDVSSDAEISKQNGEATKLCSKCGMTTEHIRYISNGGYIHWLCCSCGKDISSGAQEG